MTSSNIQKNLANAKINIYLQVLNKRNDNYHNINSLFYPIPLCDEIIISRSENNKLEIETDSHLNFPIDENLVFKAASMLQEYINKQINTKIKLIKNIPIGAGLGGGSSDAASTLLALNKFCDLKLSFRDLLTIAEKIGSDVPFFLYNKPSLASERGNTINLVDFSLRDIWLLLIFPNVHINTSSAYKKLNRSINYTYEHIYPPNLSKGLHVQKKLNSIKNILVNDFEDVIFKTNKRLKQIKDKLFTLSNGLALMSGSGSSIFALFEDEKSVLEAILEFIDYKYFIYYCKLD